MDLDSQLGLAFPWPALAEIRRSRNISIAQVAEITKMRPFYVEAIESGELDGPNLKPGVADQLWWTESALLDAAADFLCEVRLGG
jgi:hypothetical protein